MGDFLKYDDVPSRWRLLAAFLLLLVLFIVFAVVIWFYWALANFIGTPFDFMESGWLVLDIFISITSFVVMWFSFDSKIIDLLSRMHENIQVVRTRVESTDETVQDMKGQLDHSVGTLDSTKTLLENYISSQVPLKVHSGTRLAQFVNTSAMAKAKIENLVKELVILDELDIDGFRTHFSNNSVDEILDYCAIWFHSGSYDNALDGYSIILERDNQHFKSLNDRGTVLLRLKKYDDALEDLQRANTIQPRQSLILNNLGLVYRNLQRVPEAEAAYKEALDCHDVFYGVYLNYSTLFRRTCRLDDAYDIIRKGIEDFECAVLKAELGRILIDMNEYEQAEEEINQALDLDGNETWALTNMGILQFELQNFPKAIEFFERAIRLIPNEVDLVANLGSAYVQVNRIDDALVMLHKATVISPLDPELNLNYGIALFVAQKFDDALLNFQIAYEGNVDNAKMMYAICLAVNHRTDDLRILLELQPHEYPNTLLILEGMYLGVIKAKEANVLYDAERLTDEQVRIIRMILEVEPLDITNWHQLIQCLKEKDDLDAILKALDDGLAHHPKDELLLQWKSSALILMNRIDEAYELLNRIFSKFSHNFWILGNYGFVLSRKGELEKAEVYLELFLTKYPNEQAYRDELERLKESKSEK